MALSPVNSVALLFLWLLNGDHRSPQEIWECGSSDLLQSSSCWKSLKSGTKLSILLEFSPSEGSHCVARTKQLPDRCWEIWEGAGEGAKFPARAGSSKALLGVGEGQAKRASGIGIGTESKMESCPQTWLFLWTTKLQVTLPAEDTYSLLSMNLTLSLDFNFNHDGRKRCICCNCPCRESEQYCAYWSQTQWRWQNPSRSQKTSPSKGSWGTTTGCLILVTWILISMFQNLSVVLVCAYVCTCMWMRMCGDMCIVHDHAREGQKTTLRRIWVPGSYESRTHQAG